MAHKFLFPEKDATIFSRNPMWYKNTGNDAVLEIEKTYINYEKSLSRSLIKFNLDNIKQEILSGYIINPKFYLVLKTMEAKEVPLKYTIQCYPISQSWEMGVGRKYDEYTIEGVSWKYRDVNLSEGHVWFYHSESVYTTISHNNYICYNYTGSNYWENAFKFSGSFSGKFIGKIWSASFTGTYIGENISGSNFDLTTGSWEGEFSGKINGIFTGSIKGNYYSSSISKSIVDKTFQNYSGGGTWYYSKNYSGYDWCEVTSSKLICFDSGSNDSGSSGSSDSGSSGFNDSGSNDSGSIEDSYLCTQSFNYEKSDLRIDVTKIVNAWLSNDIPNEGFILKHSGECDDFDYGLLRFFSMDTNTIYVPKLDISWDDSVYNNPNLENFNINNPNVVYLNNIKNVYKYGSIIRFDVFSRNKFIRKSFDKHKIEYQKQYALPITSYFSIKDAESEEVWIDFDNHTKLSCDENGNYFILYTKNFPQERFFKVIIKVEQNGLVEYYTDESVFKISR